MSGVVYRGSADQRAAAGDSARGRAGRLAAELPKPIGIVAVTDARARQLLQACVMAGIAVPEQIAMVGIDNDPMAQLLTPFRSPR